MLVARLVRSSLVVALMPAALFAQGMGGGRIGGMGRGGRGPGNISREEGLSVQRPVNAVNLLIEHRQDLALTDSQFVHIIAIKRALDSTNAPLMRRIDSVQHALKGGNLLFGDPSPARRDSVAAGKAVVEETLIGLRENDGDWRDKAYALLSTPQLTKAQELEAKAEKELADEQQKPRARGKP